MTAPLMTPAVAGRRRQLLPQRIAGAGLVGNLSAGICLLAVLLAIVGPYVTPYDPTAVDLSNVFASPSSAHWLGTDDTGRDIASRVIAGTRATLAGPALVVLLSVVIATALAIAGAWRGGATDAFLARFLELIFCFPGLILAVVAAAVFGAGFMAPVVALSVAYIPVTARVVRAAARRERSLPYVAALQVQGASGWTICLKHLLPNLMPLIVVQATVGFGYAMLDLAAISYLGLGTQPPATDWGLMVAEGQAAILQGHPQQALFAAVAVVLVVVSVNLVGDGLARRFGVEDAL